MLRGLTNAALGVQFPQLFDILIGRERQRADSMPGEHSRAVDEALPSKKWQCCARARLENATLLAIKVIASQNSSAYRKAISAPPVARLR